MNIEHGTFTALTFAKNGGACPECAKFHQHLADRIAFKSDDDMTVLSWIRCKISLIVLREIILCIHFVKQNVTVVDDFDYACLDARLRHGYYCY